MHADLNIWVGIWNWVDAGVEVDDLHRETVDDISWMGAKGKKMERVEEVFDCWFESGSMPYAQAHYPFENKERFERTFPADFIAEGLDQVRKRVFVAPFDTKNGPFTKTGSGQT
jgi:isoleucyl-tRNA synthetase